ncbi:ADYC domain-containing protein [Corallococcus sp. BB11-1]|uniref:ADYC domain-containing protein n=1 Tax=Corallococcus sp. BB11-1 TaxID=2996783 RepID=UPI0022719E0D|nr:ADYC domain-containing protein [Corallococcus sp. BB11-1]MCY1032109.1 ADYC domain-containing protein [Corallococcus sp. BB11-1]
MSAIMKVWRQGLLGAVLLGGSGAVAEPPPTNSAQGTQLHGSERFESINIPHASVEGPPLPTGVTCATVKSGMVGGRIVVWQLSCTGGTPPFPGVLLDGPSLVGTTFRAPFEGRSVRLVIQEARCHVGITSSPVACTSENLNSGAARWEFRVSATTDDKTTVPLCPSGSGFAFAVPHAWSAGGALLKNPDYFTFACAPSNQGTTTNPFFVGGGVIAKCIDWGYAPWSGAVNGDDVALESHELCTRMARADYCGEGRSNTLDGTPLSFMGPQAALALSPGGYPVATVEHGQYALEAVWRRDSCGTVRPLCLGKKRWDSLSLEATCLNRALEAGIPPVIATGPSVRPCEDMKLTNYADDTLIVSYSLFIDRALVMFKKTDTEFVTTTSVVADLQEHPGIVDVASFRADLNGDGLADTSSLVPLRAEGPILSAKLPSAIKKRMGSFIKPLYRCVDHLGRRLLTDSNTCAPATGYFLHAVNADQGIEGYVYSAVDADSTGQRRPLKLWRHPTLGFYATSTQPPSSAFVFVKDLGYLPAVGQLPGRDL